MQTSRWAVRRPLEGYPTKRSLSFSRNADGEGSAVKDTEADLGCAAPAKTVPGFNRQVHTAVERAQPSLDFADFPAVAVSSQSVLTDSFGRFHDYLRISLTVCPMVLETRAGYQPADGEIPRAPPGALQSAVSVLHAGGGRVPHPGAPPPHHGRGARDRASLLPADRAAAAAGRRRRGQS